MGSTQFGNWDNGSQRLQDEEYHEDQEEEEEGTNAPNATIQSNDFANEEKSVDENLGRPCDQFLQ